MSDTITQFIVVLWVLMGVLALQGAGVFVLQDVHVNVFLVALVFFGFLLGWRRYGVLWWAFLLLVLWGFSVFFFPFWVFEFALLGFCALGVALVRPFLTGHHTVDFFVVLFSAHALFYGVLSVVRSHSFSWDLIAWEIIGSFLIGSLFWYVVVLRRPEGASLSYGS
jgi:hypothetical protein